MSIWIQLTSEKHDAGHCERSFRLRLTFVRVCVLQTLEGDQDAAAVNRPMAQRRPVRFVSRLTSMGNAGSESVARRMRCLVRF